MSLHCCISQSVVLGRIAVVWDRRWLLWAHCGSPGAGFGSCGQNASVARPRGVQAPDGMETLFASVLAISALIAAYSIAFCMLVWGAASSIGSLSHQACLQRVHLGRKSWKSWRCDGLKSS